MSASGPNNAKRRRWWLFVSPLIVLWLLLFAAGIGSAVVQSLFGAVPGLDGRQTGEGLLWAYEEMVHSPGFNQSVGHTLAVSGIAAVLSTAIGTGTGQPAP